MAERGAQEGNNNAGKGTDWRDAIRYELAKIGREIDGDDPAYKKGLRQCAAQFIQAAQQGEMWALKELGDRTDGKSAQSIDLSVPDGVNVSVDWAVLPVIPIDKADEADSEGK